MEHYNFSGGLFVIRKHDESLDLLVKKFRRKYMKSGILIDIRENMYFTKPSQKKRKKEEVARRRKLREERKEKEKKLNGRKGNGRTSSSKR